MFETSMGHNRKVIAKLIQSVDVYPLSFISHGSQICYISLIRWTNRNATNRLHVRGGCRFDSCSDCLGRIQSLRNVRICIVQLLECIGSTLRSFLGNGIEIKISVRRFESFRNTNSHTSREIVIGMCRINY